MPANIDFSQFRAEDGSNTKRRILAVYTGPASYVTGGDPFTAADVKLGAIHFMDIENASNGTVVLVVRYDYVNNKMDWFDLAGVEIANATDLSAYSARFEAVGI